MNLSQLIFVKTLAEMTSFSKAAERCSVTQPTLSNAVARLEDELGGRLFVRTTRKVRLTPFGENLLPLVKAVLDAQEELTHAARVYFNPAHKLIRIALSPIINTQSLTTVLEPFRSEQPEVDVIFKECFPEEIYELLESLKIDVAFILEDRLKSNTRSCFFYEEGLYFLPSASATESPFLTGPVGLEEIASETFVVTKWPGCGLSTAVRHLFQSQGLKIKEYPGQALSYSLAEQWADLGIGATILPRSKISTENKTTRPLVLNTGKHASLTYVAAWNRHAAQPEHIKEFIRHLKTYDFSKQIL